MGMHITGGLAKFGQKQYPATSVRYWALARAEVFQFGFLFLSLFSVTILSSGSGQTIFKYPNFAKPYPLGVMPRATVQTSTVRQKNERKRYKKTFTTDSNFDTIANKKTFDSN
jgi:hypothetical protein